MRSVIATVIAAVAFAVALPTTLTNHASKEIESRMITTLSFKKPWTLSNIVVSRLAEGDSSIHFHFCDVNEGLKLETDCSFQASSLDHLDDGNTYHVCTNNTVEFIYNQNELKLARTYEDDDLGPAPLYNHGTAFGDSTANFTVEDVPGGQVWTLPTLKVPVTNLVAKS